MLYLYYLSVIIILIIMGSKLFRWFDKHIGHKSNLLI
nr:MAG TPA: putative bacterial toxin [Bacteriophage sp.]